jgi:hypothetical protein
MSRNYPKILNSYFRRIKSKQINLDNAAIAFIFSNFRQLIEEKNLASKYPIINFYANWVLHTKLDRSAICVSTLSSMVKAICKPSTNKNFIDEICVILHEDKLRIELVQLCRNFKIIQILTKKNFWRPVYSQLLPEVTNKPLIPQNILAPNTNLLVSPSQHHKVTQSSYIAFWLHGKRGAQAQWSIALIPQGKPFIWKGVKKYVLKNEGMFFAP